MKLHSPTMDEAAIAIEDAQDVLRVLPMETESALVALVSAMALFCASLETQQPGSGQEMRKVLIANLERGEPLVRNLAMLFGGGR